MTGERSWSDVRQREFEKLERSLDDAALEMQVRVIVWGFGFSVLAIAGLIAMVILGGY
jgi:hypothetical protein